MIVACLFYLDKDTCEKVVKELWGFDQFVFFDNKETDTQVCLVLFGVIWCCCCCCVVAIVVLLCCCVVMLYVVSWVLSPFFLFFFFFFLYFFFFFDN